jgi:hypothetical protein
MGDLAVAEGIVMYQDLLLGKLSKLIYGYLASYLAIIYCGTILSHV